MRKNKFKSNRKQSKDPDLSRKCEISAASDRSRQPSTKRRTNLYSARATLPLLIFLSVALLISSIYRAATYPFTHDESLSFAIFSWNAGWAETANNHLLNTLLMELCSSLFGNSELSLRLPNVLAHSIYLVSTLLLLKRIQNSILFIAGFAMLNLNPFVLDFFFLARGYGLALAFMMLSLCLLLPAYEKNLQKRNVYYLYGSLLAGCLSVLANFSFLNYFLPLFLAILWLLLSDSSLRRLNLSRIRHAIVLFFTSGIFLAFVLKQVFRLHKSEELYFGGSNGFISDTVASLVRCSLYSAPVSQTIVSLLTAIVVVFLILLLLLGFYITFLTKETHLFSLLFLVATPSVALPFLENFLFQTLFPIERAALYYLPLMTIVVFAALDFTLQKSGTRRQKASVLILPAAVAGIFIWHFYRTFNPEYCYSWGYDRHNAEVLAVIDRDRTQSFPGQVVRLGNSWQLEPSLNYYITRKYHMVAPATRHPLIGLYYNYIYAFEGDVREYSAVNSAVKLISYPDTQTVLLRLNPPAQR